MYTSITVQIDVPVSQELAWHIFTAPEHITQWYFASPDWHAPSATTDLQIGGKFSIRMEAKDGSFGFDFEGEYQEIIPHGLIKYVMADGRRVAITFTELNGLTRITQTFDAENENPIELQEQGWQAILHNYGQHVASVS
jgi:uncharacterized protein YndB with AHSA1/START domain